MAALKYDKFFQYKGDQLYCEDISLSKLDQHLKNVNLTPCYVYSKRQLLKNIHSYKESFPGGSYKIGYSMKANHNPTILKIMRDEDLSIVTVSGYEIQLALNLGFDGSKIFYNGVGKQRWEVELAVENSCYLNVDSVFDAELIDKVAKEKDKVIQVLLRLKPSISANVHPFLNTGFKSKFGIPEADLSEVLNMLKDNNKIVIVGLHIHIGSTIEDVSVYTDIHQYAKKIIARNHDLLKHVKIINIGGGLAIDYSHQGKSPTPADLAKAVSGEAEYQIMFEPGRSLVANSCILLVSVLGTKVSGPTTYLVVDGAMTELIRPALYGARHLVVPCTSGDSLVECSLVGPVCESADTLANDVKLPKLKQGDLLAIMDCGAYVGSMASNYNLRPRVWEILVDGDKTEVIAHRETLENMMQRFNIGEGDQ